MQRLLSLAATFLIGSAAFAQVEPRMAGDSRPGPHQTYTLAQNSQSYSGQPGWSGMQQSTSPDPQVRTAGPSYSTQQLPPFSNAPKFKPLMYVPGKPTYPPGYKPYVDPRPASVNPPGWRPPPDHPNDRGPNQDSNGNWIERNYPKPTEGQNPYAANASSNGARNDDSSFEKNAATQWQQRGQAPGYQRVPQGGYIPVMKDGKARSFWRGH